MVKSVQYYILTFHTRTIWSRPWN